LTTKVAKKINYAMLREIARLLALRQSWKVEAKIKKNFKQKQTK
jgi:hypothetical protein